jgi:hypothetical protein
MGSSTVVNQGGYYSKTIISDETLTNCNRLNVRADATNNPINIQLPDFSTITIPASGFIRVEKIDNSANKVIIKPFQNVTACTINGSRDNIELTKQNDSVLLVFDDLFPSDGKYNCSVVAINVTNNSNTGYITYDNHAELPVSSILGTIAIVLKTSTVNTTTYLAGLWQYTGSWNYIGISVDNSTLVYNNNILQVNTGTTANKIVQLDENALLPNVSSENTTIGTIVKNNTEIVSNDSIKTFAGKTQGQIDKKQNLVSSVVVDNLASFDATGQIKDSGFSISENLTQVKKNKITTAPNYQIPTVQAVNAGLNTKANKIASPTANDIVFTDLNGQPIDSGKKVVTAIATTPTDTEVPTSKAVKDLSDTKANLISDPVDGNIVTMNVEGQSINSGKKVGTEVDSDTIWTGTTSASYVNQAILNMPSLPSVDFCTVTNDSLSGLAARNGYTPVANNVCLAMGQTNKGNNGFWITGTGAWIRAFYNTQLNIFQPITTQTKYSELGINQGITFVFAGTSGSRYNYKIQIPNTDATLGTGIVTVSQINYSAAADKFDRTISASVGSDNYDNINGGSTSLPFQTIARALSGAQFPLLININGGGSAYIMPTTLSNQNVRMLGSGSVTGSQTAITGSSVTITANRQSFENLQFQIPIFINSGVGHNFENCQTNAIASPLITTGSAWVGWFSMQDCDLSGITATYTLDLSLGSGSVYLNNIAGLRIKFGTNANIRVFLINCYGATFDNGNLGNIIYPANLFVNKVLTTQAELTTLLADKNTTTDGYYTTVGFTPSKGVVGDILLKQSVQGVVTDISVSIPFTQALCFTTIDSGQQYTYIKVDNIWTRTSNIPREKSIATWDANKNLSANNFITGYTSTTTSGVAINLTAASNGIQRYTGTENQLIALPNANTLTTGRQFYFINDSSGQLQVRYFASTDFVTIPSSGHLIITLVEINNINGTWSQLSQNIPSNSVTNAMLAKAPANTIKGNYTNSIADVTDIPIATILADANKLPVNIFNDSTTLSDVAQIAVFNLPTSNPYNCVLGNKVNLKGLPQIIQNATSSSGSVVNIIGASQNYQLSSYATAICYSTGTDWVVLIGASINALSNFLPSGKMFIGSNTNIATAFEITGPVTIDNQGNSSIGSNQVTSTMLQDDAVITSKIKDNNVTLSKIEQVSGLCFLGNDGTTSANVKQLTVSEATSLLGVSSITQAYTFTNPAQSITLEKQQQFVIFDNVTAIRGCGMPPANQTIGSLYFIYNNANSSQLIQISNDINVPTIVYANLKPGTNIVLQSNGRSYETVVAPKSLPTNVPNFSAYTSAARNFTQSSATLVYYQTKEYDTNNCYNNTAISQTLNGILVPPYAFCPNVAGYYAISGGSYVNDGNWVHAAIYKNQTDFIWGQNVAAAEAATGNYAAYVSSVMYFNGTGDYVHIYIKNSSGIATNNTGFNSANSYFRGSFLNNGKAYL